MSVILEPESSWRRAVRLARGSVVLTCLALVALGIYLGWKEGYFTPVEPYYLVAKSSKGLGKGMALRLSGFKIGQVTGVELQSDRSVRVNLAIYRQYLDFIRTDTEIRLESGLPIGDASLEITGGPSRAPLAEPGAQLRYRGQPQVFDQVAGVVEQLTPMVEHVNALLAQARQPQGELQTALRNLSDTTARVEAWLPGFLERTDATLGTIRQTSATANETLLPLARPDGELQSTLRDLHATVADFRAALPPLLADLKALTASVRSSAEKLEPAVSQAAPRIPALVEEGRRTAANAGEVVEAVKELPLIRSKVNQPTPQPVLPTTPP
ncbi:MAG: MCE family protein [Verrucomicrobia bacterium]|nr:MCE family protein [Verrucomicrobiota bacterium]